MFLRAAAIFFLFARVLSAGEAADWQDFLKPLGLSQYRLAKDIHVSMRRVNEIVLGRRGISADTALRLARYFNTTPQFWLNLQSRFDRILGMSRIAVEAPFQFFLQTGDLQRILRHHHPIRQPA